MTKMFENEMATKYVVDIHPKLWNSLNPKYETMTSDEKIKFEDEFFGYLDEFLYGSDNAYKAMFNRLIYDDKSDQWITGVKITPLTNRAIYNDGKYQIEIQNPTEADKEWVKNFAIKIKRDRMIRTFVTLILLGACFCAALERICQSL